MGNLKKIYFIIKTMVFNALSIITDFIIYNIIWLITYQGEVPTLSHLKIGFCICLVRM